MKNTLLKTPLSDLAIAKNEVVPTIEVKTANTASDEPEEIVIYDECGDTLWDKVLSEELKHKK